MKIIKTTLIGNFQRIAGQRDLAIELADEATVLDLKQELLRRYPALEPSFKRLGITVNKGHHVTDADILPPDGEVTIFPAFSGG